MAQWFLYLILFLTFISIIGLCLHASMCVHVHGQVSHSAYVVVRGQLWNPLCGFQEQT